MKRRSFLHAGGALALTASGAKLSGASRSRRKILLLSVDGFDPEYLRRSDVPHLKRMMRAGVYIEGKSVIPSVTNVNNASIVTACFPKDHGITSNYYYDRAAGKEYYMESATFLLRPTIFEKAKARGIRSAMVTVKHKLLTLLSRGADVAVSAENPTQEFVNRIGPKQDMYSANVNYWGLRAARWLLRSGAVDLLYLATTDYMMHTYSPDDERSLEHVHTLDKLLGDILGDHSNLEVYLSADHGMSQKVQALDVSRLLRSKGVEAEAIPIIRDKHTVHHQNLGGACYVYLRDKASYAKAVELLSDAQGVEEVYGREEAAELFQLRADRIGDIFLLGERHVAFGSLPQIRSDVTLRTHGSRHESVVPILCYGRKVDPKAYRMNLDISRNLVLDR